MAALLVPLLAAAHLGRAPCVARVSRAAVRMASALPPEVSKLLPPQAVEDDEILGAIVPLWEALVDVFTPGEERVRSAEEEAAAVALASAAVAKNVAVVLPYMNVPSNIYGSWDVLNDMFEEDEALEIITKNPGVLGCNPKSLAEADPNQISTMAVVATGVEAVFGPARRFLQGLGGWYE